MVSLPETKTVSLSQRVTRPLLPDVSPLSQEHPAYSHEEELNEVDQNGKSNDEKGDGKKSDDEKSDDREDSSRDEQGEAITQSFVPVLFSIPSVPS